LEDFSDLNVESSPEAPTPPRRSKARERIERRRHQSHSSGGTDPGVTPVTGMVAAVTPRATPRVRSQGIPAGTIDFKLSDVRLHHLRPLAYIGGTLLLIFGVIFGLNLFKDEAVVADPNAIWAGTEWTYERRGEEAVNVFAQKLREHRIGTVYAWVSWINGQGQWSGNSSGTMPFAEREESVLEFVQQFKVAYPEADLYAWVGFPVTGTGIPYRLNDPMIQDTVALFSRRMIEEFGFDGVFLNAEPVWNDNAEDFVQFLSRVRLEIGSDAQISVAIPPDWTPLGASIPQPRLVVPGTEWDKEFKQRVALLTDELAVMSYNSGLTNPVDYITWTAYQVEVYARAVDELDVDTRVMIGIPTHENELPAHDVMVENVSSALAGVTQGLANAGDAASTISGVAIYAEWTTTEVEWLQFKQGWANR
jgi:hypothetical protein